MCEFEDSLGYIVVQFAFAHVFAARVKGSVLALCFFSAFTTNGIFRLRLSDFPIDSNLYLLRMLLRSVRNACTNEL